MNRTLTELSHSIVWNIHLYRYSFDQHRREQKQIKSQWNQNEINRCWTRLSKKIFRKIEIFYSVKKSESFYIFIWIFFLTDSDPLNNSTTKCTAAILKLWISPSTATISSPHMIEYWTHFLRFFSQRLLKLAGQKKMQNTMNKAELAAEFGRHNIEFPREATVAELRTLYATKICKNSVSTDSPAIGNSGKNENTSKLNSDDLKWSSDTQILHSETPNEIKKEEEE